MQNKMGAESWISQALLLGAIVFVSLPAESMQNQYCSISKDHTLCKFQGLGPRCKALYDRAIPSQDRALIMNMHNTMRQQIATGNERRGKPGPQPSAANMRQMEWDDELAASAQRLADQCKYNHDCLLCRKVDRFLTGQNLYQFSENLLRDGSNWPQAINAWYDEVAEWRPSSIDAFQFIKALGHFTQIAWADTYKIGCGYAFYNEGKWYRKLYICNYGPAGNIITTPMYQRGAPCSACPEGTYCSNQYPGLCTGSGSSSAYSPAAVRLPPAPLPTNPPTTTTRRTTTTTTPRPTTTTTLRTTTTRRPTTTTTVIPVYNEIESNDIYEIENRFGFPSRKNSNRNRANQLTTRRTYSTTPRPATTRSPYYRAPTTTRPNNYNYYNYNQRQTTTTTTTTLAPVYNNNDYYSQQPAYSSSQGTDNNFESQLLATLQPAPSRFTASSSSIQSASAKVLRINDSPVVGIRDMNSIILFCDFDYAKCPIRYTGDSWNYTISETPGFGRGFESVVSPNHLTNLYIRSVMNPSGDGNICLYFRFINYRFSPDGTPAKSGSQPLSLRVTAGTLRQKPKVVEIPDISTSPRDWLTARIQFRNIRSMFLLIFQLPSNNLVDNVYVAIDDVLVTQGLCHL